MQSTHQIPIVAKFEKVSFKQFQADFLDKNPDYKNRPDELIQEIYDKIKIPHRATKGSAGHDFYTPTHIILEPGKTLVVPTGIRCDIIDGWFLGLYPRSGQGFKYRLRLNNTVGVIDADYYISDNEGHIMVKLSNEGDFTVDISTGEAFCQGIFTMFGTTEESFDVHDKRTGGFNSTSKIK